MSHRPRVSRNRDRSVLVRLFPIHKKAPIPAVKAKTGAQKCVIQRVRKRAVVVRARSVGRNDMAAALMKSRTWSMAMMMIIAPRRASTAWILPSPGDLPGAGTTAGTSRLLLFPMNPLENLLPLILIVAQVQRPAHPWDERFVAFSTTGSEIAGLV